MPPPLPGPRTTRALIGEFQRLAAHHHGLLCRHYQIDAVFRHLWKIPGSASLVVDGEAFSFVLHGLACHVTTSEGWEIDFDFGPEGRVDGLDHERLADFAMSLEEPPDGRLCPPEAKIPGPVIAQAVPGHPGVFVVDADFDEEKFEERSEKTAARAALIRADLQAMEREGLLIRPGWYPNSHLYYFTSQAGFPEMKER
jgi:hypothetical protein